MRSMKNTKAQKTRIYIDGANLYTATKFFDWDLDYAKFHRYLVDKFKTDKIYLFLGYVVENKKLYTSLQKIGYTLMFKQTLKQKGEIKGNCDAELVLRATKHIIREPMDRLVLVSSDGDFSCLLTFALAEGKDVHVISPSQRLSYLIRKLNIKITFLRDLKDLVIKEKAPGRN